MMQGLFGQFLLHSPFWRNRRVENWPKNVLDDTPRVYRAPFASYCCAGETNTFIPSLTSGFSRFKGLPSPKATVSLFEVFSLLAKWFLPLFYYVARDVHWRIKFPTRRCCDRRDAGITNLAEGTRPTLRRWMRYAGDMAEAAFEILWVAHLCNGLNQNCPSRAARQFR